MIPSSAKLVALIAAAASCAAARVPAEDMEGWNDPSPHTVGFIPVAPDVQLHYLDWGGSGDTLIFLTGIGNSAHAFDNLAPRFTDQYRVLAITRRGQAESSKPRTPYDISTLAKDVIAVMDSLKIGSANFAAHSFGGQELTRLAIQYPNRVKKLVYLDAAFDYFYYDSSAATVAAATPMLSYPPSPTVDDCTSIETFLQFSERNFGFRLPEGEIRATFVRFSDGTCGRQGNLADEFQTAMLNGVEPQRYTAIAMPVLALNAVRDSITQEEPWMQRDSIMRATYDSVQKLYRPLNRTQRDRFASEVLNSTVIEVRGAHHWIFVTHLDRVVQEMKTFLGR